MLYCKCFLFHMRHSEDICSMYILRWDIMGMFYVFMWCKMKILHGFRWDIIIFLVCDEAFCRYFMVCDEAQYIYILQSMTVAVRMEVDVTKSRGNAFVRTATTEQNARRLITAVSTRMRWGTCRVTGPVITCNCIYIEKPPPPSESFYSTLAFINDTQEAFLKMTFLLQWCKDTHSIF